MFIAGRDENNKPFDIEAFKGSQLILPTICSGNIGQLACDALIATQSFQFHRVGYFDDDDVLPVTGNLAGSRNGSTTNQCRLILALEIYYSKKYKLVVVQQRAPVVKGFIVSFCQRFASWIKESQFQSVYLLTSIPSFQQQDRQLRAPTSRVYYLGSTRETRSLAQQLKWNDLAESNLDAKFATLKVERTEEPATEQEQGCGKLLESFSSATAAPLYDALCHEDVPVLALVMFVNEGDNANDGLFMAQCVDNILSGDEQCQPGQEKEWRVPEAWNHLYGPLRYAKVLYY